VSPAEQEALDRVYAEEGIHVAEGGPSVLRWLAELLEKLLERTLGGVAASAGAASMAWWLAAGVAAVLAVLVVVAAAQLVARRLARRVRPAAAAPEGLQPTDRGRAARARAEAERALGEGRWRDVVRCTWAHVAWTLDERGVGPYEADLTNREYVDVVRARSPGWPRLAGLRAVAREVERLAYAGPEPAEDEVRRLVADTERLLGATP